MVFIFQLLCPTFMMGAAHRTCCVSIKSIQENVSADSLICSLSRVLKIRAFSSPFDYIRVYST